MWFLWEKHRALLDATAPAPYYRQRQRGGGGWRGFSPCGARCLMAAISIPERGVRGSHLGALTRRRWDQHCAKTEEEVTLKRISASF
ncbi:hypothetical protein VZT92_004502 [Zoarces viviparus]|uniref:Uncharacterized protein n=1 Tax=Zoarces viviparus TaxID=48416 RepID=A0AAW1FWY0_ZOAVI